MEGAFEIEYSAKQQRGALSEPLADDDDDEVMNF